MCTLSQNAQQFESALLWVILFRSVCSCALTRVRHMVDLTIPLNIRFGLYRAPQRWLSDVKPMTELLARITDLVLYFKSLISDKKKEYQAVGCIVYFARRGIGQRDRRCASSVREHNSTCLRSHVHIDARRTCKYTHRA